MTQIFSEDILQFEITIGDFNPLCLRVQLFDSSGEITVVRKKLLDEKKSENDPRVSENDLTEIKAILVDAIRDLASMKTKLFALETIMKEFCEMEDKEGRSSLSCPLSRGWGRG